VTAKVALLAMAVLGAGCATSTRQPGHYATVNGLRMYYEVHGSGPPLVLLHGGGSTIYTSFGKVLPGLARTRRVIAPEEQGHGHTADIDRPLTFEQTADDVAALLHQLGIARADFFGFSNGGNVALQIAIRHPALVRRLIVASAFFTNDGISPEIRQSFKHGSPEGMPAELREAYLKAAPAPQQLPVLVAKLMKRLIEFKDLPPESLRGITAPTMIMIADSDVPRPEHAVEMFRLLPHAQLAVVPGTDHMTLLDRADLQLALIARFLDQPAGP
jgi:pimeloyl-ACP methyl ester carboxylesterase